MDPDGDNILIKDENSFDSEAGSKASGSEEPPKKKAKKQSRFNGISEEELSKRLLPDLIQPDLDILIVSSIVWNFYQPRSGMVRERVKGRRLRKLAHLLKKKPL